TVRIEITDTRVTGHYLEIEYQILNHSKDDVWILTDTGSFGVGGLAYQKSAVSAELSIDGNTLTIRRRLDVPLGYNPWGGGRYIRLRPGQNQTEWIFFKLPLGLRRQTGSVEKQDQATGDAAPLVIEFSYSRGNLPEAFFKLRRQEYEACARGIKEESGSGACVDAFFGALDYNCWLEVLTSRDEEFTRLQYSQDRSEPVLRAVVDDLPIPYADEPGGSKATSSTDLSSYARVEVRFEPSALEYFFPFDFQQSLLTRQELEKLNSERPLIIKDAFKSSDTINRALEALVVPNLLAHEQNVLIRSRAKLDIICSTHDKSERPFSIYLSRDRLLDSEDLAGILPLPKSRIRAIDSRIQCGTNLKNQWYRFRLYGQAAYLEDPSVLESFKVYPPSSQWCDAMLRSFNLPERLHYRRRRRIVFWRYGDGEMNLCPSATGGKGHYAMNPNCTPDSPSDMVLLFETKAGWNQHGGPEIFTFDNHDPKGGCVLFNDGTVKFIRTKEQLDQLRWQ
ncbi:MAG: hypothetical protein ACYTE3_29970, partial [Planctomycetota bacterium]